MKQQILEKEIEDLREVNETLRDQNEDLKKALLSSLEISLALAAKVEEMRNELAAH